jgi:hypothetical protein
LVLFLQKKNTSSFSEEKEAKRLLFLVLWHKDFSASWHARGFG